MRHWDTPWQSSTKSVHLVGADWWRQAVVYQIYPRSFADRNGDGIGDWLDAVSPNGHTGLLQSLCNRWMRGNGPARARLSWCQP